MTEQNAKPKPGNVVASSMEHLPQEPCEITSAPEQLATTQAPEMSQISQAPLQTWFMKRHRHRW